MRWSSTLPNLAQLRSDQAAINRTCCHTLTRKLITHRSQGVPNVFDCLTKLRVLSTLLVPAMALPGPAFAADFNLSCQILDPATGLERQVFAPGDSVSISYSIEVPPEAADKEIQIRLSARVRIGSIPIAYGLDEFKLSFPNRDWMPDGSGQGDLPTTGLAAEQVVVDIPADFPEGSAKLRLKASIDGVGKRTCEAMVEVVNPNPS